MGNVKSPTSYSSSGLRDWIVQRVSALILGVYALFLWGYFILHPHLTYTDWVSLFSGMPFKIFTILALLSLYLHVWIGLWTILTDYIKPMILRLCLEIGVVLVLFVYLVWGIALLWDIQGVGAIF
jgi:succinate dehydrogenase / fumarate reductase, membrane anchor subunit